MNYIIHNTGELVLYFDGEKFQQHKFNAQLYEAEEARIEIESKDLQHAQILPE